MSLVEYATRLDKVKSKLQFALPNATQVRHSVTAEAALIGSTNVEGTRQSRCGEEENLMQLYQVLLLGLHKIGQRVDRSFQGIMSPMSILEREWAIVQGTAITHLTELAFFFISLSFAVMFFSMQIPVTHIN